MYNRMQPKHKQTNCKHSRRKYNGLQLSITILNSRIIYECNKSRSRDYSTQSLIIVSLTLSLAKTQGSVYVRITQRFI